MTTDKDYLKLLDASKVHNSVFDRKFMYLSDHQVENYANVAKILCAYFDYACKSNEKGNIIISMTIQKNTVTDLSPVEYCITIKDTSVLMKLEDREHFAIMGAKIRSRLGFGTILQIPVIEPYDRI